MSMKLNYLQENGMELGIIMREIIQENNPMISLYSESNTWEVIIIIAIINRHKCKMGDWLKDWIRKRIYKEKSEYLGEYNTGHELLQSTVLYLWIYHDDIPLY
jgi:hypothetical protein